MKMLAYSFVCWAGACSAYAVEKNPIDFDRQVQPILSQNCFPCHGPDAATREADLRLDLRESAIEDRGGYAAIVPGDWKASEVIRRIESTEDFEQMPPRESNRRLTAEQIEILKKWVADGAEYKEHWSFTPPQRPAVPAVQNSGWPRNEIDNFILSRLEKRSLQPSPPAAPEKWLRRVSLDLIGLPPTLGELDAFAEDVANHGDEAYASVVDRLLQSPHFGERMAIDWLDTSRYADTNGYNNDSTRSMWRWRDWVVDSFNNNVPYDVFIRNQLAGDLLPEPTLEQQIATGFNRNHGINSEGGIIDEEYRVEYVADRVRTVGMAWLGLTLECARCHDHKFDPISQTDYYKLFAFFNNVPEAGEDARVANAPPMITAPTRDQSDQLAEMHKQLYELDARLKNLEEECKTSGVTESLPESTNKADRAIPDWQLACDSIDEATEIWSFPQGTPNLVPGVSGMAFQAAAERNLAEISAAKLVVKIEKPFTLSFWFHKQSDIEDVSLLSAVDYRGNPADQSYGRGMELRLVKGELEFRLALRSPLYSLTVQSEGAKLTPGQWHQVAIVYEGGSGNNYERALASWVRLFVDGQEVATKILVDDVPLADDVIPEPCGSLPYYLGHDLRSDSPRFVGFFDDLCFYHRQLNSNQILELFLDAAIPYAQRQESLGQATEVERRWLKIAALRDMCLPWKEARKEHDLLWQTYLAMKRSLPSVMVMHDSPTPRQAYVLERGRYDSHGEAVEPAVPRIFSQTWSPELPKNRLGLAQWLTNSRHPLTSRVVVNRLWQLFFGAGLVNTSDDFGLQGERPSHPDLLDWLACEFIANGWDQKALIRKIVLSSTYRQDARTTSKLLQEDPENRLLAHGPRVRLQAEILRDQALAVAGLLNSSRGGPPVRPYQPPALYDGVVVGANYPGTKWQQSHGDDIYRRSLYIFWKRTVPYPVLATFDTPAREVCTARRSKTNTPLQALVLLNSPTFLEASRKFAERIILEGGDNDHERLTFAFRSATGRQSTDDERRELLNTLNKLRQQYSHELGTAEGMLTAGEASQDIEIDPVELAAYAGIASVILNLDETITGG